MTNGVLKTVMTVCVVTMGLAACASPKYVVSDVTRHHSLPRAPSGETFAVVASEDNQDESLAFNAYADIVERQLSSLSLRPNWRRNLFPGSGGYLELVC